MKVTHCTVDYGYGIDKGIVCKTEGDDLKSSSIDKYITCKKCLKLLGTLNSGEALDEDSYISR